ncbi:MAG: 6-carboxytetrahydropterin synthase, partial [Clostridia bacterium]|nr:6-carboxytetrahydropterin synthase [Clostridia bacterium]
DKFDHCLIIEKGTLKQTTLNALFDEGFKIKELPFRPTAEEFARYFYYRMTEKGYNVKKLTVYETPNNCAAYEEL